jgi:uncharacterized protein involved in exopolysaccharide biosynthesis
VEREQQNNSFVLDYIGLATMLWSKKRTILFATIIVIIGSVGAALSISNKYKSTAVVLPINENSMSAAGGLSEIASMAGISVGGAVSWVELYPDIISSDMVLRNVIYARYKTKKFADSVNLIDYFEYTDDDPKKGYDKTYKALDGSLNVQLDRITKILSVSITLEETDLAATIVNNVVRELDNFIKSKRISNATEKRNWIDQRLRNVASDLKSSENALKEFRERNRIIKDSPQLNLEQERLIREVQINSTLFIELKKQLELAKIDEINMMPIVNILEYGRPTSIKESPQRSVIVLATTFFTVLFMVGYFTVDNIYGEGIRQIYRKFRAAFRAPVA